MSDPLDDADTNTLVLETGRRLERAVRKLIPDRLDAQGKPLTLGPRMRQLRERLGPEAWAAYEAWSRERNAYTHAEIAALSDEAAFRQNFATVEHRLRALARKPRRKRKSTPAGDAARRGPNVVLAVVLTLAAVAAYYSC